MDALFEDPWTIIYKQTLARFNYVKVKTIRLQGILLSVFCLKKHILHLRDIETQYTKTGLGGVWVITNKPFIMPLSTTTFLFVRQTF